uniref:Acyl-CoA thioesterase 19 n=1 Tax=Oryzias latipes TaxID=8090 RepID=A0A3B3IC71_ORYLA
AALYSRTVSKPNNKNPILMMLSVHPSRALMDEAFVILVQNVPPGFQVTLHALHRCEDGHRWEACAHYVADSSGNINAADDCSVGGSYFGVEPMGLLWSLKPVPGSKPGLRWVRCACDPTHSNIHVNGPQKLHCCFGPPKGPGPFPGLLDLWGGGGQLMEYRSALLASHGIASLALDYLTRTDQSLTVPVSVQTAYRVLQQHPQVLGSRIAMLGLSLGTVFTLKMAASLSPQLRCAVCISGSHIQPVSGEGGVMCLCYRNFEKISFSEQDEVIWRGLLLPIPSDPSLKVDVGRLQCPLLLVVGEDDQNWCSHESATDMKQMMERAGNDQLLTLLSYPGTGHLIEPPYTPHTPSMMVLWGGKTPEHSAAQEDSWRKIVTFLRRNLYGGSDPHAVNLSHL